MSQTTTLSEGNIFIRPFCAEDIQVVFEAVRESINEVSPWLPWCHTDYKIEETTAFIMARDEVSEAAVKRLKDILPEATREQLLRELRRAR